MKDHQEAFHGTAFHVLTFVSVETDADPMPALSRLAKAAEHEGSGELIYAGKVIYNALVSPQITAMLGHEAAWDAILLQQFASRQAYDAYTRDSEIAAALEQFPIRYAHGMHRSAVVNVLLQQMLLLRKLWRRVTFTDPVVPFEPATISASTQFPDIGAPLLAAADNLGKDAIFIVNLSKDGTEQQQAADASYGSNMLGLMADLGYGPLHVGGAVAIEQDLDFDRVAIVYYPGSRFFHDLIMSTWFQSIIGDKQLADTQASVTVPITHLLTAPHPAQQH